LQALPTALELQGFFVKTIVYDIIAVATKAYNTAYMAKLIIG